jgi:choloylglycine hydrolase
MCVTFKVPRAADGSVVAGRSLEFPAQMPTALAVLPSDYQGSFITPGGQPGRTGWTASHGVVGMCAFGEPTVMLDGLNTAGLSVHVLYMPGFCEFQPYRGDGSDVAEAELGAWLLGTCADTGEVRQAMRGKNVWGNDPGMGFVPPCHVLFHDKDSSIALEFHAGGWQILDNPPAVATNAPYLEWHLLNLSNYTGLSATDPADAAVAGMRLKPFGQGQGLRGLPGDYSSPSRFVRAVAMTALADQPADGRAAEQCALHLLNSFDIVGGAIREPFGGEGLVDEVTVWDTIVNLTGQRYAYRTMTDPTVYVVDLAATDFSRPARVVPLSWQGDFQPVTV